MPRTKHTQAEIKSVGDAGQVDIQFSTYGGEPDSYGDIIDPGAFTKAIEAAQGNPRHMPYLVWSHDWNSLPLGQITSLADTPSGPVASCQFDMDDPEAIRVFGKIRKGLIREASFGFDVEDEAHEDGANHLKSIYPLYEVSPVLVGANRNTSMLQVRSAQMPTIRELSDGIGRLVDIAERLVKAEWSTEFVNNLPDSSFAYIEDGGEKDDDGKTKPRTLRHYPIKDASGKPDEPHVRNAYSRAQAAMNAGGKTADIAKHAMPKIQAAAKTLGITLGESDDDGKGAGDHEEKAGARNSAADQTLIQAVHDHACTLGANCVVGDNDDDRDDPGSTDGSMPWVSAAGESSDTHHVTAEELDAQLAKAIDDESMRRYGLSFAELQKRLAKLQEA